MRVLLVEDEIDIAEALQDVLELEGHVVALAGNGREGLSMATADPPEVIVTDLMMPVMDGHEMIEALRRIPATSAVPIIVISANEQIGHQPCLRKPFRADALLRLLAEVASGS